MNDQELLTYAAKAAGYIETASVQDGFGFIALVVMDQDGDWTGKDWNPLENDADAFQLAVELKMELISNQKNNLNEGQRQCRVRVRIGDGIKNFYEIIEENSKDISPIRRAIVMAAAEIGKGM